MAHQLGKLIGVTPEDQAVIDAIIYLHDIVIYPKSDPRSKTETQESAKVAGELLVKTNFPTKLVSHVTEGISGISLKQNRRSANMPGFIAGIADKLDQTGAMFLMRYAASSGEHTMIRKHYNKKHPFGNKNKRPLKQFQFTLDAQLVRRSMVENKLDQDFISNAVRTTMAKRNRLVDLYNKEMALEISEVRKYKGAKWLYNTGAMGVMKYCKSAGKQKKSFYDETDPFAENGARPLQPEKFPLDAILSIKQRMEQGEDFGMPKEILQRRKNYLSIFLVELKSELAGELVLADDVEPTKFKEREEWANGLAG